jgi:O-antigen/teichoic acid export membrane protein
MSRTSNSIRNIKYAVLGQAIGLLVSFISRIFFVRILSAEYLGVNGLFTNILSVLSLAELGVGSSIVYSMYKPLAEKDEYRLKALMGFYKKAYITIGIIIAVLGTALIPFLEFFIKDKPNVPHIQLIYLMFVVNSSISYFFSYKRSLIIADQKRYIATFYRYGFYFLLNIAQIIALVLTKSYILYLGLQIINTFIENIYISRKANELYPFLKGGEAVKMAKDEIDIIVRNVKAMMFHKLGGTVVMGTDNLLISKFVGVIQVGLYSNYLLIIKALNTVFGLAYQSITASIGNLGVIETNEKNKFIFECINLLGFWIYGVASICLINLFNPFIILWLGKEYLFPISIVLIIVINFYLTGTSFAIGEKDIKGIERKNHFKIEHSTIF